MTRFQAFVFILFSLLSLSSITYQQEYNPGIRGTVELKAIQDTIEPLAKFYLKYQFHPGFPGPITKQIKKFPINLTANITDIQVVPKSTTFDTLELVSSPPEELDIKVNGLQFNTTFFLSVESYGARFNGTAWLYINETDVTLGTVIEARKGKAIPQISRVEVDIGQFDMHTNADDLKDIINALLSILGPYLAKFAAEDLPAQVMSYNPLLAFYFSRFGTTTDLGSLVLDHSLLKNVTFSKEGYGVADLDGAVYPQGSTECSVPRFAPVDFPSIPSDPNSIGVYGNEWVGACAMTAIQDPEGLLAGGAFLLNASNYTFDGRMGVGFDDVGLPYEPIFTEDDTGVAIGLELSVLRPTDQANDRLPKSYYANQQWVTNPAINSFMSFVTNMTVYADIGFESTGKNITITPTAFNITLGATKLDDSISKHFRNQIQDTDFDALAKQASGLADQFLIPIISGVIPPIPLPDLITKLITSPQIVHGSGYIGLEGELFSQPQLIESLFDIKLTPGGLEENEEEEEESSYVF